jgi:D-lyxose ketol-isomerase
MIPHTVFLEHQKMALAALRKNRIYISNDEAASIEIADFGLSKTRVIGLQTFLLIKTNRVCLKIIVLLPHQICPEHKHSKIGRAHV